MILRANPRSEFTTLSSIIFFESSELHQRPRVKRERRESSMDLLPPCNSCSTIYRQPTISRKLSSPRTGNLPYNYLKCRSAITSEIQTPVGVTGQAGSYAPSIPTHKVTVHDRQRGVVHEFFVPEVCLWMLRLAAVKGKIRPNWLFLLSLI